MTGDPKRLLSELSDADSLERELLASIQPLEPPQGAKGAAWASLSAQIAGVAVVTTAHGNAAASLAKAAPSALKLFSGKLFVGLALASAAGGGVALWRHARAPLKATPIVTPGSAQRPRVQAPEEVALAPNPEPPRETSEALPGVAPSASSPRLNPPLSRADRLAAESSLLTQARAELRRGDVHAAQRTLNRSSKSFPNGVLGQEREVLGIELLAAGGNAEAASRRARAFIAAYPNSPHSAQLSRFAGAP